MSLWLVESAFGYVAYVGHACSSGKGGAEGEGRGCQLSSSCPVTPLH